MRGPYRKLRTRVFSILRAQARSARAMRKKQGSVTYGTDRANEINKMFIIWLFETRAKILLFWSETDFELLLIFSFSRSISKRARKFPRFLVTHVVSVGFQISQSEWMFERNFQFILLLASLIGFSVSYLTDLRDVSVSGNQKTLNNTQRNKYKRAALLKDHNKRQ